MPANIGGIFASIEVDWIDWNVREKWARAPVYEVALLASVFSLMQSSNKRSDKIDMFLSYEETAFL